VVLIIVGMLKQECLGDAEMRHELRLWIWKSLAAIDYNSASGHTETKMMRYIAVLCYSPLL